MAYLALKPDELHIARHSPELDIVCMDGVYAPGLDGKPEFFALRPPENGEVRELAQLLAKRIPALLIRRGVGTPPPDEGESDRLARDQPWLAVGCLCRFPLRTHRDGAGGRPTSGGWP